MFRNHISTGVLDSRNVDTLDLIGGWFLVQRRPFYQQKKKKKTSALHCVYYKATVCSHCLRVSFFNWLFVSLILQTRFFLSGSQPFLMNSFSTLIDFSGKISCLFNMLFTYFFFFHVFFFYDFSWFIITFSFLLNGFVSVGF